MVIHRKTDEEGGSIDFMKSIQGISSVIAAAIMIFIGSTTWQNSLSLAIISEKVDHLSTTQDNDLALLRIEMARIDQHLNTIWPRLREIKERIQYLESLSRGDGVRDPWQY